MSIMHVYVARDAFASRGRALRCPPTAGSSRSPGAVRTEPPQVTVPLNRIGAGGHTEVVARR